MDEFLSIGTAAMSSDETPKIEPTLTDAPSIAPEAKPEAAEIVAPKTEPEAVRPEAPKVEAEKIEPKIEAPSLPPAAQIAEPGKAIVAFRRPEAKAERPAPAQSQSRSTRFALLAACVAIAASFGAIGGSLGVAKFGPMMQQQQQQQQQEAQDVNVLLPEPPSPVSEKDFAPAEVPPPKQAGGGG
jgi:hypothetical protein